MRGKDSAKTPSLRRSWGRALALLLAVATALGLTVGLAGTAYADTVLGFSSDVHNTSSNSSANRLGTWIDKMRAEYGHVDLMAFGGDMGGGSLGASDFWTCTQANMTVLDNKGVDAIYTTGNHEYMNGSYTNGTNSTTKKYVEDQRVMDTDSYHMYCMGTAAYGRGSNWNVYDQTQIDDLDTYLGTITDAKPVIIITHYPLHWTSSRSITGSGDIITVLNKHAAAGRKIVFLWGHNHTDANGVETHYDEIFAPGESIQYASGKSAELDFYYAAAGCMSDSDYGAGSGAVKGKGLIIAINDKSQLSLAYYDANGNNVTEDGNDGQGSAYSEQDPVAATKVTIDEKNPSIEAARSVQLHTTVEPADATTKKVTWSSSNEAVAKVSSTGKVRGVSEGTATITATLNDKATGNVLTATTTVTVTPRTSADPEYVIVSGGYALSVDRSPNTATSSSGSGSWWGGSSSSYTYTGLAGVKYESGDAADADIRWIFEETDGGYYIKSTDGLYLNATYTSGSNSGQGDLKLDDTPDVWVLDSDLDDLEVEGGMLKSTNASTGNSSDKYLAYEDSANLFTVRSESNADKITVELASDPIATDSVTVSPKESTIEARKTVQLTATVKPDNATGKVSWTSSNTSIATVDSKGLVRGKAEGTVTITATSGGKSDTATVKITPSTATVQDYVIVIDNYALTTDRSPNTAQGGSSSYTYTGLSGVAFTTADEAPDNARWIFEETDGGYYIMSADGQYLSATYESGSNSGKGDLKLGDTKDVWVLDSGYSLDDGKVEGSYLKSTNASSTASSDKFLGYENNENLFSVRSKDNADKVTIEEAGEVVPVAATKVTVSPKTDEITVGKTTTLKATVEPANSTDRVVWSSNNTAVATVDSNGKVTGKSAGTAKITATAGSVSDSATITVNEPDPSETVTYVLTDKLEADTDYLIASGNSGSVYLLSGETASTGLKGYAAEVVDGKITIDTDLEAKTAYSVEAGKDAESFRLVFGEKYLYTASSGDLRLEPSSIWNDTSGDSQTKNDGKYWHYKAKDGNTDKYLLWFFMDSKDDTGSNGYSWAGSTYRYYVDVNGSNFVKGQVTSSSTSLANTSTTKIYLFAKDTSVTPVQPKLDHITVISAPDEFKVGDEFTSEGIKVSATSTDGAVTDVSSKVTVDSSDVDMTKAGTYTVVVSYTEGGVTKTATYEVTVSEDEPPVTEGQWVRVKGKGRYQTMAAIVDKGFETSDWAVVATGDNFPDALVASSLAGSKDCPVILTDKAELSPEAEAKLTSLKVKNVYIMGGTGAVSADVEDAIEDLGIEATRVKGAGRQATSLAAMKRISGYDTIVVATGGAFADALSIGPWCYAKTAPILLTDQGALSDDQLAAIEAAKPSRVIIVGGTGAVPQDVEDAIAEMGITVRRLKGANRYETSKAIARFESSNAEGMGFAHAAVATGKNFPDALAGAALCGHADSVLVLAADTNPEGDGVALEYVKGKNSEVVEGYVLGGNGVVSDDILDYLNEK